ncbi:hypothetical protein [Rhodococcoides yunnanense]|uniref:hypothetical protein n=1 Tax=Rhodococcoides yunnanense TaxID=278209 RepID=UPI0012E2139A|nr:hypothetical protein [Rhodococcus yunnanensis]
MTGAVYTAVLRRPFGCRVGEVVALLGVSAVTALPLGGVGSSIASKECRNRADITSDE